ncbi:MAG: hypothetical protein ABFC63_01820 [Thermoguttaceae bacterium]
MSRIVLSMLVVALLIGCDREPANRPAPPQQQPPAQAVEPEKKASPAPAAKPAEPAREKAQVGVGEKGRDYPAGMYAPKTYWAIKETLAFDVQIPKAMQLFKATEGRAPKDHAEFMERIIKEGMIQLPELPAGDRYEYDPKTEELMVAHGMP